MKKPTKKQKEILGKFDFQRSYPLQEGIGLVKKTTFHPFDPSVDICIRLGINPQKADQMVRGVVNLPHGNGKTPRILVLCSPDKEVQAKEAGADYVGLEEYLKKINQGWLQFDVIVATPDIMPKIAKLARIIGPKGLMPSPKTGSVTLEVGKAVKEIKSGKISFKTDKAGNIHASIARVSYPPAKIKDNAIEFINTVVQLKPSTTKGTYIRNITLSSTMGKGVNIDQNTIEI